MGLKQSFNNWFCGVVGYHFCLTHRRSPVRARAESLLLLSSASFFGSRNDLGMGNRKGSRSIFRDFRQGHVGKPTPSRHVKRQAEGSFNRTITLIAFANCLDTSLRIYERKRMEKTRCQRPTEILTLYKADSEPVAAHLRIQIRRTRGGYTRLQPLTSCRGHLWSRPSKHLLHIHPQTPRLKSLLLPTRIPILPLRGQIVPHSFTRPLCQGLMHRCRRWHGCRREVFGGEKRFGSVGVCVLGSGEGCLWDGCFVSGCSEI